MNYGMLKSQIINKININSFNILEKDCKDGNPVPGATTRFSFIKSGDLMQTKKNQTPKHFIIMGYLLRMQLTHQFQIK